MCRPLQYTSVLALLVSAWAASIACSTSTAPSGSPRSRGAPDAGDSDASDSGVAGSAASGGSSSIVVPDAGPGDGATAGPQFTRGEAGRSLPPPEWNCGDTCYADPEVPADPASIFAAAAPGGSAPTLVYPLAGSMHPLNLPDIAFHWTRISSEQTLFRLRISGVNTYDLYLPCHQVAMPLPQHGLDTECVYDIPESNWAAIALENAGASVSVELAATDAAGAAVGTTPAIELHFAPYDIIGGLYYWSTAIRGTYRLVFGQATAQPFIVPYSQTNTTECGGCHAVSRDGKVIAFTAREAAGALVVASASDATQQTVPPSDASDSSMIALTPDGTRALVSHTTGILELRDTESGASLGQVPKAMLGTEGQGYFPEFSPSGSEIVLTLSNQPDSDWSTRSGSIAIMPYNNGMFGNAQVVVAQDADFHFYPTWSPDGNWIAFASAPIGAAKISYNQPEARLRLASRDGNKVYELGKATVTPGRTTTMPKFSPFALPAEEGATSLDILFLTFNSKINYGVALKNDVLTDQHPQLWMAAIDLRKIDSGDPSFAPIWLPFQDVTQNNHLGYWTSEIACIPGGCGEGAECGGTGSCVVK